MWKRNPLGVVLLLLVPALPAWGLDQAREKSGVDRATAEFGVSGKGVLVAIIDRGIDILHPAFRNPDGSTRFDSILDLTDDAGAKRFDNPYGEGTIYMREHLDRALRSGRILRVDDKEGRGTTSVGIACGNGAGSPEGKWRGVAPGATPLFVKIKLDPLGPRTVEIPAEGAPEEEHPTKVSFFELHRLRAAIDWCVLRAKALKLPCVMCLNFDQIGGPTDGSSILCRTIDQTVGPGIPGLVLVTSPGDKGDRRNRARGLVRQGGTLTLPVVKEDPGEVSVDIWYSFDDRFDVAIRTPTRRYGPYKAPKTGKSEYEGEFQYYHLAPNKNLVRARRGKRQIRVDLIGPPGAYAIELRGAKVTSGRFDATIGPNPASPLQEPFNHFPQYAVPGSLWDGASAHHVVCPGCYVNRTEWHNYHGRLTGVLAEGDVGDIWRGSGTGPTADGRHGVDFCAPADRIIAPYARRGEWATKHTYVVIEEGAMYGASGGGGAAAAFTAGVVALMLERNPALDAMQVKSILQETARRDTHTGPVPNATWGHGKLDAYAAVARSKDPKEAAR